MSFSLIAILAVAVAITSAFTTVKTNHRATTTFDVRELPVKTYTETHQPTVAQAEAATLFNNYSTQQNLAGITFTVHCTADAPNLCFAQVKIIDGVANSIVSTSDGDFH